VSGQERSSGTKKGKEGLAMEFLTTYSGQKTVGIQCLQAQSVEAKAPKDCGRKSAIGKIRLTRRAAQGLFMAALLAVCVQIGLMLVPSKPAPVEEPAVAVQGCRISSVSIPILGAPLPAIETDSPHAMITQLKSLGLWELEADRSLEVPAVLFTNFPDNLGSLQVSAKKKVFFRSLLPVALIAMAEVEQERGTLQEILGKLGDSERIVFSDDEPDWQERLSVKEQLFIRNITEKYRTKKAAELLDRVDTLPVSLVLAQGAFESFWGTSRFARQGNNLFGMWTWGDRGIIPARRDPGKTHKLVIYDSILDSVRDFVLTLNRLPAYKNLRKIRKRTTDSQTIADGLYYYSERHNAYIKDVKTIIRINDLTRYDRFVLANSADLSPEATRLASL